MKRKKEIIHKKADKRRHSFKLKEERLFGLEGNFIMIFGGGFLVIALGLMIFH